MIIETILLRRMYWTARFTGRSVNHVGTGRTEAEAIGNLILVAAKAGDTEADVIHLPKGENAHLPAGK